MQKIFPLVLSAALFLPALASADEDRLRFKANGYSIAPLEGMTEQAVYQSLMMFLPLSEGFTPNVNVQIQAFDGGIEEYVSLSRQQFEMAGLKLLHEKFSGSTVVLEYAGPFQGREMHWYARAVEARGKIYLVTATATESQWGSVGAQLKANVDSFRIEGRR